MKIILCLVYVSFIVTTVDQYAAKGFIILHPWLFLSLSLFSPVGIFTKFPFKWFFKKSLEGVNTLLALWLIFSSDRSTCSISFYVLAW